MGKFVRSYSKVHMLRKLLFFSFLAGVLSCTPYHEDYYLETRYRPVLMDRSDLEESIAFLPPQEQRAYGKIYRQDNLLFINEPFLGVHVVDNSDPRQPKKLGFIRIPGNIDIAMKGNYLYADNAVDLITLRWEGNGITVTDRNREVFPEYGPPDGEYVPSEYQQANRPPNTVIIKWEEK